MSAPRSRRLRNQTAPVTHSRREITIAVAGSAAVVLSTLVLIWAMRPGDPNSFTQGKGGLIHRQPRVALWLLVSVAAVAFVAWLILRRDSKFRAPQRAVLLGVAGVVIAAVAVFATLHTTLVHDYAVPTTIPPITTTTPPITSSSTVGNATTTPTTTATTTATTIPGATTTPATAASSTSAPPSPSSTGG